MLRPLSDFPVVEIDGCYVVQVPDWQAQLKFRTSRQMGRPLRHECPDLWIVTSDPADAAEIAKLVQRHLHPEDPAAQRNQLFTNHRQPTFAAIMPKIPSDVACTFSTSSRIDDQGLIQRQHPAPARVNERIFWASGKYHIRSTHGHFQEEITAAPRAFPAALARAREKLLAAVGPGFDISLDHLNASPMLAAMLSRLTRPAAEAAAHWLERLGTGELDALVIPRLGIDTDLPIGSLHLESKGVNLHASFFINMGDMRVTEFEVSGLNLPDTLAATLDAAARRGEVRLSQIIDLPGAEDVPVLAIERRFSSWSARLDPVSVPIAPPRSDTPFVGDAEIRRITEQGNEIGTDAALALRPLGAERAAFILYCVEDGSSGMHFDISAWMPSRMPARLLLRERTFKMEAGQRMSPAAFIGDL